MPRYDFRCEQGHIQTDVRVPVGTRPPCPDCGGATEIIWRSSFPNVIADDVPGGFLCENLTREPVRFYSKSAWRAFVASKGARIRDESGAMPSAVRRRFKWGER